MDFPRKPLSELLDDLQQIAGDAPFLALGQTVFWDEPMKGGVALAARRLGKARRFVAGVHDTDYFAKLPFGPRRPGKFKTLPHNDTTTKGLWSAAGEFSALFGSETVITREDLLRGGVRIERVTDTRPEFLDEATEAWHWKGIVSLDEVAPITADVPLKHLMPELKATFDWAMHHSLRIVAGEGRKIANGLVDDFRDTFCTVGDRVDGSVADFYEELLPAIYDFSANARVPIETNRTSRLLKFNRETCALPRFAFLNLFIDPATRQVARDAYDEAISVRTGFYELARFGTGAIPFDLVIPGRGRGTIRIGTRGIVINTPTPEFFTLRKPLASVQELAELIEGKFGPDCAIVGKAVALIGMLAREFVFVFHEGASSYVRFSRKLHQILARCGYPQPVNPILRIQYDAWSALRVCCTWLRVPWALQGPFGTEELCAPSFASRWQQVGHEQEKVLAKLGQLRRPVDLIEYLDDTFGGAWKSLAEEYRDLREQLAALERNLNEIKAERRRLYQEARSLRVERVEAERAKGEHWRSCVFERNPGPEDLAERERLTARVEDVMHRRAQLEARVLDLRRRQKELVDDPEVVRIHDRRRSIEIEAELKRTRMIRDGIIASRGLEHANLRPSAWWFRLVSPDGLWFRETVDAAEYYLEPLT